MIQEMKTLFFTYEFGKDWVRLSVQETRHSYTQLVEVYIV